jgi:uncharacterized coiled-coil protein SlyX
VTETERLTALEGRLARIESILARIEPVITKVGELLEQLAPKLAKFLRAPKSRGYPFGD